MKNRNYLIIAIAIIVLILILFVFVQGYKNPDIKDIPIPVDSTKQTLTVENIEDKVAKIFSSWEEISSTEYKMVRNDGKVYSESIISIDNQSQEYSRTNNIIQGLSADIKYVKEVSKIQNKETIKFSDNSVSENIDAEYKEIFMLETIRNEFMNKLSNFKLEDVTEEIVEEKAENGLNRIKVKIMDTTGLKTTEQNIYPYELLIEYSDTNEINLVGLPMGVTYTLFTFNNYNQAAKIEE